MFLELCGAKVPYVERYGHYKQSEKLFVSEATLKGCQLKSRDYAAG